MAASLYAVPGTNAPYAMFQATVLHYHSGTDYRWTRRYRSGFYNSGWTWHKHEFSWMPNGYKRAWYPSRSGFSQDPGDPHIGMLCYDLGARNAMYARPRNRFMSGNQGLKFIMGLVVDSSGNAIGGAVVAGFRTSDNRFVRTTTSDSNGMYELGTEFAGEQHYLVAYVSGSPDIAGTTVKTLVPTNRDGSP
jgi:hypothetical protein